MCCWLQFGHVIGLLLSSKECTCIDSNILRASFSSLARTLSFTPPIALLTKGSVSIVILSLKKTAIPSASKRPFIIWASDEY